jgi:hypothetical protein
MFTPELYIINTSFASAIPPNKFIHPNGVLEERFHKSSSKPPNPFSPLPFSSQTSTNHCGFPAEIIKQTL